MQYVPPIGATDPNASYVEGDPTAGIRGSYPTAAGYEAMMREVCNAALLSGQTANPSDLTQTFQAIAAGGIWVGAFGYAASTTVGAVVTPETYSAALPTGGVIPTLTSLRTGTRLIGFAPTANATTSPVLTFTGVGSGPVTAAIGKKDATAPAVGDVAAALVSFRYDGTKWRVEGLVASDIAASASQISGILGTLKSIQNVELLPITGRALISGSDAGVFEEAWSGSYTKKSATSVIIVWPNLNFFNAASPNTGVAPTTLRLAIGSATPVDTFAQVGYVITNGAGGATTLVNNNAGPSFVPGLGAGAQTVSIQLSRADAVSWYAIRNPGSEDSTAFPTATASALIIAEVEQSS